MRALKYRRGAVADAVAHHLQRNLSQKRVSKKLSEIDVEAFHFFGRKFS